MWMRPKDWQVAQYMPIREQRGVGRNMRSEAATREFLEGQ